MKTFRVILWSVVAIVLSGILILGMRGELDLIFPYSGIDGCNINGTYYYSNSELYTLGGAKINPESISEIEVNWVAGRVDVALYDGDSISFEESTNYSSDPRDTMRYFVSGNKLIIQFCESGRAGIIRNYRGKTLTLYVPRNLHLNHFDLFSSSASVKIEGINANTQTIESVSGSVIVSGLTAESLNLSNVSGFTTLSGSVIPYINAESVSGAIELYGIFDSVTAESVSGGICIAPGGEAGRVNANSVSGSLKIELPDNKGFSVHYSSVSGRFSSNFETTQSKSTAVYRDGYMQINLETVSGSMSINRLP